MLGLGGKSLGLNSAERETGVALGRSMPPLEWFVGWSMAGRMGSVVGGAVVMPKGLLDAGESMGCGSSSFKGVLGSMAGSFCIRRHAEAEDKKK